MTAQTRPDELIRILRAEFTGSAGSVGGACVVHTCGVTGWRAEGGTISRVLIHESAFQLDDGGNARGLRATDLQIIRDGAANVASGAYAVISGGRGNQSSGISAVVAGGYHNWATAHYSAVLGGWENRADNYYSCAFGKGAKTNSGNQIAMGNYNAAYGDCQGSIYILEEKPTHSFALWYTLTTVSPASIAVPVDTVMTFRALVVGTTQGCTKSFGYEVVGVIKNDGGTTTILAQTITTLYEDDISFDCRAWADDVTDELEIQVHDADGAGDTVLWNGTVITAEVSFPA